MSQRLCATALNNCNWQSEASIFQSNFLCTHAREGWQFYYFFFFFFVRCLHFMLFLVFCAVFQCLSCRVGGGGRWWVLGGWARWALSVGDWWAESTMHDSLPRIRRDACVALVGYYDLVCVRNASLRAFYFSVYFFLSVCSKRSFWLHKFVIFGFLFHVRCQTVIEVYRNARDGAHLGVCVCVCWGKELSLMRFQSVFLVLRRTVVRQNPRAFNQMQAVLPGTGE